MGNFNSRFGRKSIKSKNTGKASLPLARRFSVFEQLENRTMLSNSAPTLTSISTIAGATEDTPITIPYATLLAQSDAADADGDVIKFKIMTVGAGATLKKGSTAVTAGTTLVGPGETLTFTGAANANGTLNAFTVKANDGTVDQSTAAVQVTVDAAAVEDAPNLTSVNTLAGATEDSPYTITYAALNSAAQGATDADSDPITYQVTSISSGKLTKNGVSVNVGDNGQFGSATLNPGETWVWTPGANANGTLNAFMIKSFDGQLQSATAQQVKITTTAVNDAPTLTTVNTLTGATEDTAFTITYATLVANSDLADVDGTTDSFRIESVTSGTLTKNNVAVVAGTTQISTGDSVVWTPASNVNGTLAAFTLKAIDSSSATSSPAVQVNVATAAADDAPTLTAIDTFAHGTEDQTYDISYAALVGASDLGDIDSPASSIGFKIVAVTSGTLSNDAGPVTAGTTILKAGDTLHWTPAANANGLATNAFTVKANDGSLDSATAIQVKVDLAAVPDAPTLTAVTTLTGGTEDTALSIPFATFNTAANKADVDTGATISYRIESVTSGTLTKSGSAVTPGVTTFAAGETLVWTPAANANGSAVVAFTVRATDGTLLSTTPVQVTVNVAAVNDAPTLTRITVIPGGTEDTALNITHATLLAASDANDVDGTTPMFRIEAVSSGTLKKNGTAVTAGTTTITAGDTLVWTPAADANGLLNAFTVKAYDGTAASGTAIQVVVSTAAVNDAPTLTAISNLAGGTEDTPLNITYAAIAAAATKADVDSSTINYQITSLGTGTLKQNGLPVSVGHVISSGDTLVWTPAANANGTGSNGLTAFGVKATDGALLSATEIPVKVDVAAVNDVPTMTTISTLTGATEDTAYTITYAALAAATNAADVEGAPSFRIESLTSGTLTKGGVAITQGTTTIGTGETLVWTPAANANGTLNAFTIKAFDGSAASTTALQVKITTAAVNDAPTLTTISSLGGGTEDTPYTITYSALSAASNAVDVDSTVQFQVTAVTSGTLTKNGVAVVAGTTTLSTGESLVWTPAANVNGAGTAAFTVKAYDGLLTQTTAAVAVKVDLTAVNDAPTLTSITNLTGANEDAAFSVTYTALKAASNAADVENSAISFKIISVTSGTTLTKGGVAVVAGTTLISTGDTVIWTPAANANGIGFAGLPMFTVEAYDGALLSTAPVTVKADVAPVNDAPTLTTMTTFTGGAAATEDTAYNFTFANLVAAGDQADIDNSVLGFEVAAVSTGTLTKNGVAVVPGTTVIGPGEVWTWTPAANANGSALNAFTVKAWDGTAASSTAVQVKIDVTAVNDAPTLSGATLSTGSPTEDLPYTITYAALVTATGLADADAGDTLSFRIEAVSTGTLTLAGSAVVPGTDMIAAGDSVVWTPASNANGILNAFTVTAYDGTVHTASPVQIKVNVAAVNDGVPTYGSLTAIAGGTEDTPVTITYATLATANPLSDVDPEQSPVYRIAGVTAGSTLTKNGVAVTTGASGTLVSPGDTLIWTPGANVNGSASNAFTVYGYDGVANSGSTSQVKVDLAAVNDAPTMTTVNTIAGGTEDTALTINFADIVTNAADVDTGDTISYKIIAINNGTLTQGGSAVTPGTTVFASADTNPLIWTPSADVNGTIPAFSIEATDGTLFSSTPIVVNVTTAPVADTPTLTAISTFTGGVENTPLTITYADLAAHSDMADADGTADSFKIIAVSTGTLTKAGVAVVAGTTTIAPGESVVWTPTANANGAGLNAFTVKATDGGLTSATAIQVKVNVAHVAQLPTLTTISTLTANTPTEDTAYSILFADIDGAGNAVDPEGGTISYRIDSITSGTLTKGGTAVVPGVTLISTGDTVVWTPALNANGTLGAFTVRASTTAGVSTTAVAVKVTVAAVNDTPTLTAVSPISGESEDHADFMITYANLLASSDAKDVDGDPLSFDITAVSTGVLKKVHSGVTTTLDPVNDSAGVDVIGAGDSLLWTPAANANGALNAFTIKADDGTLTSASSIQVKVNTAPVDDAPTLTTVTTLTGANAGVAYSITFANLLAAGNQADIDSGTINFVINSVVSGTLTLNGVPVLPGITRFRAGETLVWTSTASASGDTAAFTIFATDGQLNSASPVTVTVNVT